MGLNYIPSCSLLFISWLQDHLLPCPFKYLTGIDCPGCGFQRSMVALLKGDIHQSFLLYPPAIPLLIISVWWLADSLFKLDTPKSVVKKTMFIVVALIITVSYIVKMARL
ncbi:MAG: DUF2752 domain-containing protein [Mucilaginibacter sp.]|jgi:hypothetical protein|uniref:DUF2752 domain-containing protein n=1 Tax=Mucilaginibacter sp. TaxID=1882438 RepID=UPI003565AF7F